ncbi:hypothetical protein BU15DRAFT_73158 [Melanogaster broomeanus]|nr:hypothetical protein BU15DRAFT_73158 [Melanogaster broomeanus]
MPSATGSTLEFSHIQTSQVSKYQQLRVRVSLDGNGQESQDSSLDAGVHMWHEPFSFDANPNSLCEIHVFAWKRKFFCCAGRYKAIRKTRPQSVGELLDTRGDNGVVQLPLYNATKTDRHSAVMGNVIFLVSDMSAAKDSLTRSSTRGDVSCEEGSTSFPSTSLEAVPSGKLSLVESESEVSRQASSLPPRPMAPTPPTSPPSASPTHYPPYIPPQSLVPSPDVFTPLYLQPMSQLPPSGFVSSKPPIPEIDTHGDATMRPKYVLSPGIRSNERDVAAPSLICEGDMSGLAPRGSSDLGTFTPVICEPPDDMAPEGLAEPWLPVLPHTTDSPREVSEPTTLPQISITLARSSRGNSPLASSCESDVTTKRPNVHVNTGSAAQVREVGSTLSPRFVDEPSSYSHSTLSVSPQPTTSTTNTGSCGLSPFSRTSMVESPDTAATTPASSAALERPMDDLASVHGSPAKQRKERPTIDTSCIGPRGQVRKYRNGSVPPVHVPVKLRNASLDLPRCNEYDRFEPNPSMYSIAPSISPRCIRNGDLRCPPSQPPSRQGFSPSTRAASIRREPLEYDEGQICLDTANLGDQDLATFLKEVDAALSAAVVSGSPAVAADGRAFLSVVPGANSRLASRHQSRKPSSQQLRADLSATIRSPEKEDGISSRVALSGQADTLPRLFVSQGEMTSSSKPVSPSRGAMQIPPFTAPQRMSPQPSSRQELAVEWAPPALVSSVSSRTKEPMLQLTPAADPYNGDVDGNETIT